LSPFLFFHYQIYIVQRFGVFEGYVNELKKRG